MSSRTLGYAVNIGEHAWYQRLIPAAVTAAAGLGYEFVALDARGDHPTQVEQVDALLERGIAALALSAVSPEALGPSLDRCAAAGVPVITESIRVGHPVAAHLGIDEYAVGVRLGRRVGRELAPRPILRALFAGFPPYAEAAARESGFLAGLRRGHEVVDAAFVQGGGTTAAAERNVAELLVSREGWCPDVLFGVDDEVLVGALGALEAAGVAPSITATYGLSLPRGPQLLDNATVSWGAAMLPEMHGRLLAHLAIDAIGAAADGPRTVLPGAAIVTCAGGPEGWDRYYRGADDRVELDEDAARGLLTPADRALYDGPQR